MEDNFFKFEDEFNENKEIKEETTLEINDDFVIGGGFVIESENKKQENPQEQKRALRRKKKEDRYEYYEDTPERRRKSIIKTVIWAVCIFTMAILLAVGIIYFGADYMGIGFGRGKTATIEIPLGSSTKTIAEKLEESGAVKSPFLFRIYSKLKKYDGQYKYGVYTFDITFSGLCSSGTPTRSWAP